MFLSACGTKNAIADSRVVPHLVNAVARTVRSTVRHWTAIDVHPGGPNRTCHFAPTIFASTTRIIIIKVILRICLCVCSTCTITCGDTTYRIVRERRSPRLGRFIPGIPRTFYAWVQYNAGIIVSDTHSRPHRCAGIRQHSDGTASANNAGYCSFCHCFAPFFFWFFVFVVFFTGLLRFARNDKGKSSFVITRSRQATW